jgi:hypothetical protein
MFLRTAYLPNIWKHRTFLIKNDEYYPFIEKEVIDNMKKEELDNIKEKFDNNFVLQDIVGPLCFSGYSIF